jgi:hypothetical protein
MKTMNRTAKPAMLVYGAVLGLIAWIASGLSGTGLIGFYSFGLLGMTVLFTFLMWPKRRRFIRNSSTSTARARQNSRTRGRRNRQRAL